MVLVMAAWRMAAWFDREHFIVHRELLNYIEKCFIENFFIEHWSSLYEIHRALVS